MPAALEDAITEDNVDRVRAASIFEVANGPVSPEADDALAERGVPVIPDILANAGGVTVSYFEWVQNRSGLYWSAEEVAGRLRERMLTETGAVWDLAEEPRHLRSGGGVRPRPPAHRRGRRRQGVGGGLQPARRRPDRRQSRLRLSASGRPRGLPARGGHRGKILLGATALRSCGPTSRATPTARYGRPRLAVGPGWLHLDLTLGDWVQDGFLAIFFFVAGMGGQARADRR
ncbi:MAG: hypothetical protein WKF31_04075 [Thermoleophilaceae bacterium]